MSASNDAAQALYAEITRQAKKLESEGYGPTQEAEIVRDLAAAFRHVAGGPQPGGTAAGD